MASINIPRTLKNCNIFIQGTGYAGLATEIELPQIGLKMEDHTTGLFFPNPVPMGGETSLKVTISFAEYSGTLQNLFAKINNPLNILAKGTLSDDKSTSTVGVSVSMTGVCVSYTPSSWQAGKKTEDKYTFSLTYLKFSGNKGNVEIDANNNRVMVDGEDIVETLRNKIKL